MFKLGTAFLKVLGGLLTFWQRHEKADSLIRYTKSTRVEPIVIVDQSTMHLSYLSDIMQSLNSIFAAYYLQAAAISVNIGRIDVGKLLGHLNPERSLSEFDISKFASESRNAAMECLVGASLDQSRDYRFGLPTAQRMSLENLPSTLHHALEETVVVEEEPSFRSEFGEMAMKGLGKVLTGAGHMGTGAKMVNDQPLANYTSPGGNQNAKRSLINYEPGADMRETANLSIGRMYTVEVSEGNNSASIPIMVRLLASECSSNLLVHILSDGAKVHNSSAKERKYSYKMGDLQFWRDIVAATDLIDEHRDALMQDNTGVYKHILKRRRKNSLLGLGSFKPSVGTASNMVVTTRDTIHQLEKDIGGKFSNPKYRNKIFERSYLMIVVVVDPDYDHVTFYYRGIDLPTELSVRDIKQAAKGSGPDVLEVLKMFQAGQAPSF